jgi:hypothetical protein
MKKTCIRLAILLLLGLVAFDNSDASTIGFEELQDLTSVTDQYSSLGVTFSAGIAAEAGVSLFEQECPPHSGDKALLVEKGPLTLLFVSPVTQFSAYLTYAAPMTLTFYDLTGSSITMFNSYFFSNLGMSGDAGSSPNEFFSFQYSSGISKLVFSTGSGDDSYVLDDITVSAVPEPAVSFLLAAGILSLGLLTRKEGCQR